MRLIRRIEQIIQGSPAEIAALHRAHVDGFGPEPPAVAPAQRRPSPTCALLYRCSDPSCRMPYVVVDEPLRDQLCPRCTRRELQFADYCLVQHPAIAATTAVTGRPAVTAHEFAM